ncbi:NmrA family NAD(P)-binding protein [Actinomadura madurae]|uniref:NmrA family NAD(P)-binding protein n=1 Tax=Actinomadura madurae TaxID=1993 RepID=UPI00399B6893
MSEFLVTGATGRVGRHVAASLAGAGHGVRALVRSAGAALPDGVEAVQGDLTSPEAVERAAQGVDGVYLMWPGLPVDARIVDALARHVRHVVYLSTDVADLADGETATSFHQGVERLLRKSGLDWTFVRAIDFAANALAWAGQIRQGVVRWPYGDAARSLIHERDIADVAVLALTAPGHRGSAYVITGPEAITHREQVRVIGEVIGRDVRWEDLPPDIARERLTAAWGDAAFVQSRLQAWERFAEEPERVTDTVARLLGRPARTFRQWAEDHASDFR